VPIGQQPLAVDRVGEAERRQVDEQVHLGDAELEVLALGRELPFVVEGMRSALKVSASEAFAKSPRRFTQGPRLVETVTSGEVVTMRVGQRPCPRAAISFEDLAEAHLRRHPAAAMGGRGSAAGTGSAGAESRRRPAARRARLRGRLQRSGSALAPSNLSHSWPGRTPIAARKPLHLGWRHQPGVVVLVALPAAGRRPLIV
jgi:hypothetical protein